MRIDRRIWGPGPTPGSRVLLATEGTLVTEEQLKELERAELKPEKKASAKKAPAKKAASSSKKDSD